jgi:uncharacterized protein DUF1918
VADRTEAEIIMMAHVGDRLILDATDASDGRRVGIITAVRHDDGAPPYLVRWLADGRTSLIFPGPEALIEPPPLRRVA